MRRITHRSLCRILATASVFWVMGASASARSVNMVNEFGQVEDVPAEHWARKAVSLMIKKGFVTGFPDGNFHGKKPISRYEAAVILSRMRAAQLAQLSSAEQNIYKRALEELGIVQQQLEIISQAVTKNSEALSQIRITDRGEGGKLSKEVADLKKQVAMLSRSHVLLANELNKYKLAHANNALHGFKTKRPVKAMSRRKAMNKVKDAKFSRKANVPVHLTAPGVAFSIYGAGGSMPISPGMAIDLQLTKKPKLAAQFYSEIAVTKDLSSRFGLNAKLSFGKPDQDLNIYALIGPGGALSQGRYSDEMKLDPFINVGFGTEYRMASNFNLLADITAQYFLSNDGRSTGLEANIDEGVTFAGRLGAKFLF